MKSMSGKTINKQAGMVSILVSMIMIIVISLIVLGFSKLSRSNQQTALDRQLSTQAFYAAETGINDAKAYVLSNPTAPSSANCNDYINTLGNKNKLNGDDIAYTCLVVNNEPPSIKYATIPVNSAVSTPLFSKSVNITRLNISWQANAAGSLNSASCSSGTNLPSVLGGSTNWDCAYGLLRLDLMPVTSATGAAALANTTRTFYFKPSNGGSGQVAVSGNGVNGFSSTSARGTLSPVLCSSATKTCSVRLDLSGVASQRNYYARISAVYKDLQSISISGQSSAVTFTGSQVIIDSTGKARDVLRRLQTRVSLTGNSLQPAAGLQTTGSICKLISVKAGVATGDTTTCPDTISEGGDPTVPPVVNPPVAGDAKFQGCRNTACDSGPGTPNRGISWGALFQNTSTNPASEVLRCTWEWGDGASGDPAPIRSGVPTNPGDACLSGQTIWHEFYPGGKTATKCYYYNVKLTIYLKNGLKIVYPRTSKLPYGDASPCKKI